MQILRVVKVTIPLLILAINAVATDTLRVMHYNLLYYDGSTSFCTQANNNVDAKDGYLTTILSYYQPDIFTANEINGSLASVQRVLTNTLNTDGKSYYRRANYTGSGIVNMIYYNSSKLALKSQSYILTTPRITDVYTLYHLGENLSNGDTLFLTCIVTHLKAGQSDARARAEAAQQVMNFIGHRNITGNILLMGDLNVYTSSEAAFQTFLSPASNGIYFADPVNAVGSWHGNPDYAPYHTQSTRTQGGCFAAGGMDNRFDFILASPDVLSEGGISYVYGSYWAMGQDGMRFDSSLIAPANTSVPAQVLSALYSMSDHLPVTLKLSIDYSKELDKGIEDIIKKQVNISNPVESMVYLTVNGFDNQWVTIEIFNTFGIKQQTSLHFTRSGEPISLPAEGLAQGVHVLRVKSNTNNSTSLIVKR